MAGKPGTVPHNKGNGASFQWLKDLVGHTGDDCIIWPFSRTWNGYGHLGINGVLQKAHRIMCFLAHGNPPEPKYVAAHSCNNGHLGCVNPRHLSWKTPRQNLLDRRAAGTLTKKRWTKKGTLTDDQIAQIIALKGQKNQREIAAMFGISYQHVSVIQNGRLRRQQAA